MSFFSGKSRPEYIVAGIFFLFAAVFSFLRSPIAEVGAWTLALSREIRTVDDQHEDNTVSLTGKPRQQAGKPAAKPASNAQNQGKPQTRDLPKTETPIVLFSPDPPSWNDAVFAPFPKLRKYTGDPWDYEETEIRAVTNGRKLYILARLYDRDQDSALTHHSESQASAAWRDDGIEVFIMKNTETDMLCQYILSVSGIGHVFYLNTTENPSQVKEVKAPEGFIMPYFESRKLSGRFELEIDVALENVGIKEVKPGDSFLIQIVRNYRGQGVEGAITLQLFPSHIYSDKRFGLLNRDRRGFQPVKIVDSTIYSTLKQDGKAVLKHLE
ncbi:MAG: hypothetical protein JW808_01870 [Victivallales bacterium]|nr:hypothetical protein [Victivallales bacterium]